MDTIIRVPGWAAIYALAAMWMWGFSSHNKQVRKDTRAWPILTGLFWPVVLVAALISFGGALWRGKAGQ